MNPQLAFLLNQAVQHLQSGNLDGADTLVKRVISADKNSADALHIQGVIYGLQNRHEDAIAVFLNAVKLKPGDGVLQFNLANALMESGKFSESLPHYKKSTQLIAGNPDVWINYGKSLKELKRFDEALGAYEKAIFLNQNDAEAWNNKGVALNELKRFDEAIAAYDKALALNTEYAEAWYNKGFSLHDTRSYSGAVAAYDRALSLNPNYAEAWNNKAVLLHDMQSSSEAITAYERALAINPNYAEAWNNQGATLHDLKRFDEAIISYDKALTLNADYAEAWYNKGITLNGLKNFEAAIAHYDKALGLKEEIDWVYGDLLHTKMKICSWSDFSLNLNNIVNKVSAGEKLIPPFSLLSLADEPLLQKKCAEIFTQDKYPPNSTLGPMPKHANHEKIRIAYFSADFQNHPVSFLTAELFEIHDRSRFEVFAFSLQQAPIGDEMNLRLRKAFDRFIDVASMSDLEIAKLSRELHIDIAVDLGGHTAGSRTGIFAYRAAPVQVSYLGYLGTMGAEYVDYVLADKTIIPDGSESYYSEKITFLPSYQVNDRKRAISNTVFTRQELGLPEKGFVFCCFNNNYKILPSTFDGWMRILKAVEGSVLFLYAENEWAEKNLKQEAEARGISATRLVFGERLPADEYLARYHACDLFLDTAPYNAGTTASDALWTGLPVLTFIGKSFASRVAASLLHAIGLPELITNTQEEYEALAIDLAMSPKRLAEINLKLANNRLTTPLFNTQLFAKNLEAAYINMYGRYHADLKPDNISIN